MSVEFQRCDNIQEMMGINPKIGGVKLSDIACIRKNITNQTEKRKYLNTKFFCMYSSPKMNECQTAIDKGDFWCHCFRKENISKYIPDHATSYLLSESDFTDPMFINNIKKNRNRKKKYDFFYITLNNGNGFKYKGLNEFIDILKTLCIEKKLRGQILCYWPNRVHNWKVSFSREQKKILKAAEPYLTYYWGWQEPEDLCRIMSNSKFGVFPNVMDCSPRIITECLVRDVPVLVNKDIWGGWKYIEDKTGRFLDMEDIPKLRDDIDFLVNNQSHFLPKRTFLEKYGFENSSYKLAKIINKTYGDTGCSHIYFDGFGSIFKDLRRRMRKRDG